jgi:hypothetical protein
MAAPLSQHDESQLMQVEDRDLDAGITGDTRVLRCIKSDTKAAFLACIPTVIDAAWAAWLADEDDDDVRYEGEDWIYYCCEYVQMLLARAPADVTLADYTPVLIALLEDENREQEAIQHAVFNILFHAVDPEECPITFNSDDNYATRDVPDVYGLLRIAMFDWGVRGEKLFDLWLNRVCNAEPFSYCDLVCLIIRWQTPPRVELNVQQVENLRRALAFPYRRVTAGDTLSDDDIATVEAAINQVCTLRTLLEAIPKSRHRTLWTEHAQ